MDLSQKKIWALLDDRQGNTSQTLGVAEALGVPFETKKIEFNELIRIPNILINKTTIGFRPTSRALLTPPWPDIVIGTARRLGIVASYIKSQSPKTFLAQIQWPGFPADHFDLIATPKHDGIKAGGNVLLTLGAPHRVKKDIIARDAELWREKVSVLPSPRIAVLVGGNAGSKKFSPARGKELAVMASSFANLVGGSLMITTSRRTGSKLSEAIEDYLTAPNYFYDWKDEDAESQNPFFAFLGLADAIIATGDSISMCSEACATGKPVYIYITPELASSKHQLFINNLFEQNLAKPLLARDNQFFTAPYCLDDSLVVAEGIRKNFTN